MSTKPPPTDSPKRFITREILSTPKFAEEDVYVPRWDAWVKLREMSGAERDAFEAHMFAIRKNKIEVNADYYANFRAKLLVRSIVDEAGNRMFSDAEAAELGSIGSATLAKLCETAQRLNGMTEADAAELVGNSDGGPVDASPSA